jgi:beta-mannosidase
MRGWGAALTCVLLLVQSACRQVDLQDGFEIRDGWKCRSASGGPWDRAVVPGCVHTDLLDNDLIDDPFYGANEQALQWIEDQDWEYRTVFDVSRELLAREHLELDFGGLDTYADVYLNDSLLLVADNMFRRWRVDCTGVLRGRGNVLRIYFHSPVAAVRERWKALEAPLPGGPRVFARKAAYQYGWDWAPRFVTSGIWRPVYLRAWDSARIADVHVVQKSVTAEAAMLEARFEIESGARLHAVCSAYFDNGNRGRAGVDLVPGRNEVTIDFAVPTPRLWWTNGLGEPYLYHFLGELRIGDAVVDWIERRVGIRTIELVQEPDAGGESFSFRLNGIPLFVKGANYVPQDCFPSRVTPGRYEDLIAGAANAGMNMLRVWGGGIYEDDLFYDLCDEYGILVWQDFMFACAMYPADDAFLANVEGEAIETVKRLRGHPCVALWCGNNEIDEAWHHWGWQRELGYTAADSARIWRDYETLFDRLLPTIVETYDPAAPYVPSSPRHGRAEARSLTEGDAHYWGVWHDGEPFEILKDKIPRFMSEFGFQALPALSTIALFAPPEDWSVDSPVMRAHEKHPRGGELILKYMERWYRVPQDFEAFVYVSQLLQAEGMKLGIESERRAKPYCMGTLYWQLNDCWPAVSWSSIDWDGTPKALYYFVRNAYREVLISPVIEDGMVRVYVVSDRPEPLECRVILTLVDFTGDVVWSDDHRVKIRENSSRCVFEADLDRFLRGRPKSGVVLSAEALEENALLSENLLYFALPKELDLPAPRFAGRGGANSPASIALVTEDDDGYVISICAQSLVKNLYLSVDDHAGFFDDNFFDILPGSCVTVHFVTPERIDDFDASLTVMSLTDTY